MVHAERPITILYLAKEFAQNSYYSDMLERKEKL